MFDYTEAYPFGRIRVRRKKKLSSRTMIKPILYTLLDSVGI